MANDYIPVLKAVWNKRIPGQLVIQLTDRCNAHCPQCGMRVTNRFPRSTLAVDTVKRILDAAAQKGVKAVSFTGGEPLLYLKELQALISHAAEVGIEFTRTGTNGYLFRNHQAPDYQRKVSRIADALAQTPLRTFWVSLDSAIPHVHEKMRGFPGVIKGIEKALPIFHDHGIYPSVNLGINRNVGGDYTLKSDHFKAMSNADYIQALYWDFFNAFNDFYRFVINLGFTISNACYPMSINGHSSSQNLKPVYGATSKEPIVSFTDAEKAVVFKALLDAIPSYRSKIRVFSPLCALYALYKQYIGERDTTYPCQGGVDFFFIDAKDGYTYPCGYRGHENLGYFWDMKETVASQQGCTQCDWECFRDPSEMFGPLLQGAKSAWHILRLYKQDREFFRYWIEDFKYYRACQLFNGRMPPDFKRMGHFGQNGHQPRAISLAEFQFERH